jgi:thiol-disulfide isomerase/thioredoxin
MTDVTKPAPEEKPGAERRALVAIGVVALLAVQVFLVVAFLDARGRISDLEAELDTVQGEVWTVQRDMTGLQETLAAVQNDLVAVSSTAPADPTGQQSSAQPTTTIETFSGAEYYSGTTLTVDPADGKARAYLVWSHWCPYCQQELPEVQEWYAANAASYPDTELVSIHTFEREDGSNPLVPYLDDSQFDFPVLLDDEPYALALQVGNTGSVPYWIFTDGDGNIVGQQAGGGLAPNLDEVFAQLQALASGS